MGKVWLITGASRGMGAQIASAVLQAGHLLVATARRKESLADLPRREDVLSLSLDVTIEEQARAAARGRFCCSCEDSARGTSSICLH